jgi:hypothetical protein
VAYSRLSHKGGAVQNTLGSQLLVGGTTISLSSTPSGWPAAGAPFFVVIDPGTAKEEKLSVVYVSGTTLNVVDETDYTDPWATSVNGRGVDDTTAYQHEAGAVIYPVFTAREANQANELVSSYTANGDLVVHGSTSFKKIAVGTNAHVLQADSTVSDGGVKWGQVATGGITDGAVTEAKLATDSVTATKIAAGAVGASELASNAVETAKIADDAVTQAKIGAGAVGTTELADDAVTAAKIGVLTNTTAKTDSFTLALGDENTTILCNKSTGMTVTIPLNSSVAFAVGTQISFVQLGAGQVTFAGAGGVTLNSDTSKTKILVQYGVASCIKTATDTWVLFGQLTA